MADSSKEIRQLLGLLTEQGFVVKQTSKNYYEVRTAEGDHVINLSSTPSEYRGFKNAKAALRRHGFLDPKRPHKKKHKRED